MIDTPTSMPFSGMPDCYLADNGLLKKSHVEFRFLRGNAPPGDRILKQTDNCDFGNQEALKRSYLHYIVNLLMRHAHKFRQGFLVIRQALQNM